MRVNIILCIILYRADCSLVNLCEHKVNTGQDKATRNRVNGVSVLATAITASDWTVPVTPVYNALSLRR